MKLIGNLKSVIKRIREYFKKIERKKVILLGVLTVIVITAGIVGTILLNQVKYTVLYSDLNADEAGTIMNLLKNMSVKAKVQGTNTIMVPEEQADEIRIELAAQGYPKTGLNYSIFSGISNIGSTDLERKTYLQYQLQENMRTTVSKMDKVKDCIVIVNLPTDSSFVLTSNTQKASVSVMLSLKNDQKLSDSEAKTIGRFVLKCVPNLEMGNISIVDSKMNYYDLLSDNSNNTLINYSSDRQKLVEEAKRTLSDQVLKILKPAIGQDNVSVSVNLDLNFDKNTTSSVTFAPPVEGDSQGLLRSSQQNSNASGGNSAASGQTGTGAAGSPQYVSGNTGNSSSSSASSAYSYELNQIKTDIEKAQGSIQNLSVAVLVNKNVSGISNYVDSLKNLVANAIGVNSKYISIELIPFVSSQQNFDSYLKQNQEVLKQLKSQDMIKYIILAAVILLAGFVLFVFLKKKKTVFKSKNEAEKLNDAGGRYLKGRAASGGRINAAGEAREELGAVDIDWEESGETEEARKEKILKELVIKKSNEVEKVEELLNKYPETAVQIIRTWLTEDR